LAVLIDNERETKIQKSLVRRMLVAAVLQLKARHEIEPGGRTEVALGIGPRFTMHFLKVCVCLSIEFDSVFGCHAPGKSKRCRQWDYKAGRI
jgi:hypothetical protein